MGRQANSAGKAGRRRRKPVVESAPQHLRRTLRAAFDETRAGLLAYLRSHPGAGGSVDSAPLSVDLFGEATIHLLRLLVLLYADGHGLLPRGKRVKGSLLYSPSGTRGAGTATAGYHREHGTGGNYILWKELQGLLDVVGGRARKGHAAGGLSLLCTRRPGTMPGLKVPDASLLRVLDLLSAMPLKGGRGRRPAGIRMDIRGLGDAYEIIVEYRDRLFVSRRKGNSTRPASARKIAGRYYTPERVVEYVVKAALGRRVKGLTSRQILGIKVLDPAMGTGHFLLSAADLLATAYGRARVKEGRAKHGGRIPGKDVDRYRRLVIEKCVYGVDTDPVAVDLARLSLWLLAGGTRKVLQGLAEHLRCGDALSGASFTEDAPDLAATPKDPVNRPQVGLPNGQGSLFHWATEFPEVVRRGRRRGCTGFDVIVGNPPYVSFSGRQKAGSPVSVSGPDMGNSRSPGWPSAHGLFILRATELIGNAGIISFITPGQVGLLRGYGPIRSGLLDVCELLEVRYWGESVFRGVTTPALTFLAERRGTCRLGKLALLKYDGKADRFSPEGEAPWYISSFRRTLERMAVLHVTIEGFTDPGVHTGNVAARLLLSRRRPGSVPIIEGRQVRPFHCDPPGKWLNLKYKPSGDEYFRVSDAETYKDTDILLRQTASRPIAARHSHRCHFRNSALALKAPEGFSVEYLLGILNSKAARRLYQADSPESLQRAFPQIKVGALRRLPIPDPCLGRNRPVVARIEKIVRSIEVRARDVRSIDRLLGTLDLLVRNLYGLEGADR